MAFICKDGMKGTVRRFWRYAGQIDRERRGLRPRNAVAGDTTQFWRVSGDTGWDKAINSADFWKKMTDPNFISDEEIWALRYRLRRELVEFARRRLSLQGQRLKEADFISLRSIAESRCADHWICPAIRHLQAGAADFPAVGEHCAPGAGQGGSPHSVHFCLSEAHPRDDDGKRFIQQIIHLSKFSDMQGHLVFIENYDVHVARQMVSGCDIWLNNPAAVPARRLPARAA